MNNKKNKRIKILYITPSLASGGAERLTLDLIYGLNKDLFSPSLLLFAGKGFFYDEAVKNGVRVKSFNKKYRLDILNFYKIYRYIKKEKPAIVHTQMGADIYGRLAARLAGVKTIVSTEHNVLRNYNSLTAFLKKKTASWSDRIICVSGAIKRDMVRRYDNKNSSLQLIYNGINIEKFDGIKRKKFDGEELVFGSLGRLTEQKNYSLLIRALSKIKGSNFKFLIAGEGELRGSLQKEIDSLGINSRIELVGVKKDVRSFLASLDFFILPSKWEGLGIVLLEAGLARLPVLASNTGGISEIVSNGKSGILFKNESVSDLTEKINYFLNPNNREKLDFLGENLYNRVVSDFDIKKMIKKYEEVYLSL